MTMSMAHLFLMAFSHLLLTSLGVCCLLWIACSHLSTYIRWLTSDISICSSLILPFLLAFLLWLASFLIGSSSSRLILPTPRIVPSEISGHAGSCCHIHITWSHIAPLGVVWQLSSMCHIDSVSLCHARLGMAVSVTMF